MSPDIGDAELGLSDYIVYRDERNVNSSGASRGRGVLIAVTKDLPNSLLDSTDDLEQLFVKVGLGPREFIIGCIYLPPRSHTEKYSSFSENVDILSGKYQCSMLLFGDFNLLGAI